MAKLKQTTRQRIKPRIGKKFLLVMLVAVTAGLGVYLLQNSSANTTTTADANCGKRVSNYNYQVPFGNAVWNQPICGKARHPKSADYASRFYNWGHLNDGSASADIYNGRIGVDPGFPKEPTLSDPDGLGTLYTREVYYASKATTQKKVTSLLYESNLDGTKWNDNPTFPRAGYKSTHPDTPIPWNPDWKTGMGGDNEIFILDDRPGPTEGRIYTIWQYKVGNCFLDSLAWPDRICGSSINVSRDHYGNHIDYRTHEGYVGERGVGLSYYATLTTPEEVAAGEIRHALGVAIPNTSYGPECSKAQQGTSAEGTTCGTAVAPASKFEWADANKRPMKEPYRSLYGLNKTIPEGMRFALDMTETQIDNWVKSRTDLTGERAKSAKKFAMALKDYGMIVVDTNGQNAGIQLVGGVNPDHAQKWKNLGMGPEHSKADNLLNGLITSTNLYVVDPPTATCEDGTKSKYYCKWTDMEYPGTTTDTVKPTVSINSPASNATVSGNVTISGTASDYVGVSRIEILIGTNQVYNVTSNSNYSFTWNSQSVANGSHVITIRAFDVAGNMGSITRTVNVSNTTVPPPKPADFNRDGKVNLTDLSVLLTNYGKTVPAGTNGDTDGDGKVGLTDLSMLLSQYGT